MSGAPSLLDFVSESDLDRLADVIADLLIAGARRQAARTNAADDGRPLGAGARRTTHEAAPAPASNRDGFAEDSHRDELTPAADQV
jgi:hypothetical protein